MKTKESIDKNRLEAFEAFTMFFLTLGMGGVIYLLVRVTMAALEMARDYLALIVFPAVMFAASAVALGTCVKWAIWG